MSISTKICKKCNQKTELNQFYKRKTAKDGLRDWCIKCEKDSIVKYRRTKKGLIYSVFRSQNARSLIHGYDKPQYNSKQLFEWAIKQNIFHELFDKWVESGYDKMLVPSFDRLDDYKGYNLSRLRIVTWQENKDKFDKDRIDGINNKKSKAVIQWSLEGNFIKEFYSMANAARETGTSRTKIVLCCKGKRNTSNGFRWSYKQCTL